MRKKRTLNQLLDEFKSIHGQKYGYDLVNDDNYHSTKSKIPVLCRKHNHVFYISVEKHLYGQGCPICANEMRKINNTGNIRKRTKLVWGVGINDYEGCIKCNRVFLPSYHTWEQMLKRCYSEDFHLKNPTYKDCYVCNEWLSFSNFKRWFDNNNIGGYALDKDILIKGNKCYSPTTCCFVPIEINSMVTTSKGVRKSNLIGTSYRKDCKKYCAYTSIKDKRVNLGVYNTQEEAFIAYKKAKEQNIRDVAQEYFDKGLIAKNVYNALMKYKVEKTD